MADTLRDRLAQAVTQQSSIGESGQLVIAGQRERFCLVLLEAREFPCQMRIEFLKSADHDLCGMRLCLTLRKRHAKFFHLLGGAR